MRVVRQTVRDAEHGFPCGSGSQSRFGLSSRLDQIIAWLDGNWGG
jgi:hypothetical protein